MREWLTSARKRATGLRLGVSRSQTRRRGRCKAQGTCTSTASDAVCTSRVFTLYHYHCSCCCSCHAARATFFLSPLVAILILSPRLISQGDQREKPHVPLYTHRHLLHLHFYFHFYCHLCSLSYSTFGKEFPNQEHTKHKESARKVTRAFY